MGITAALPALGITGSAASTIGAISTGLSIFQGVHGFLAGTAAAKAERRTLALNNQIEQERLRVQQRNQARTNEKNIGAATVAAAASGATLGSFDTLIDDTTTQGLLDSAMLEYDSKLNTIQRTQSSQARQSEFKSSSTSSLLSGLGSAASSGYQTYKDYQTYKSTQNAEKARGRLSR